MLATDEAGSYYVLSPEAQRIQVFSRDGRFIRSVGRRGDGPGEFRFPNALHVDQMGRLFVADRSRLRVTVFDADLSVLRTIRLAPMSLGFELIRIIGDSLLLSGHSATASLFGLPVHVYSPEGQRVRSFGLPDGPIIARDRSEIQRTIALERRGHVWVASKSAYTVELWSIGGERIDAFSMDVDWFEPIDPVPGYPPPPRAALGSVRQDGDGLLWLRFVVPGARWREAAVRDATAPHGWRTVEEDLIHDTIIDVVDPYTHRLLARKRLPGTYVALFGGRETLTARTHLDIEKQSLRIFVIRLRVMGAEG